MALGGIDSSGPAQPPDRPETKREGPSSRPAALFREALKGALAPLRGPRPSSAEGKLQFQAIKAVAQLEVLRLNTTLLRAFGLGSGPENVGADWGPGSEAGLWSRLLDLVRGQDKGPAAGEKKVSPAQPQASPLRPSRQDFDALIDQAAQTHGLDPDLVRAVVKAESDFEPASVSKAGAMGLMQLMPGTAAELGVEDPFDPVQNVFGGTRYLRQMLDRYRGDMDQALGAYNWGPSNVDRWWGRFLPEETRTYIARVRRFYRLFSSARRA